MGKEISHILCAEQAASGLAETAEGSFFSLLGDNPQAYHFGSIAADTFFYCIRLPFSSANPPRCGDLIHGADGTDTGGPVHEMLKDLRDKPNDPMFARKAAFAAGFLTHLALDSIIHPYVYHFSGNYYADCPVERREARVRHRLIEAWIDLHLLGKASPHPAGFARLREIRRNGAVNRELLDFFFSACRKSLDIDPSCRGDLMRGYGVQMALNAAFGRAPLARGVRRADRMLGGRLGTFLALFYPTGHCEIPRELIHFDHFSHPVTGERMVGGFQGLWSRALERSGKYLLSLERFLFAGGDDDELRSSVRGYNLSTGLEGVSMGEAVHYDRIPLERLGYR